MLYKIAAVVCFIGSATAAPKPVDERLNKVIMAMEKQKTRTEHRVSTKALGIAPLTDAMTCYLYGDPHVYTFEQNKCNLFGLGVFKMVDLPNFKMQAFHCPPPRQQTDDGIFKAYLPSYVVGYAAKVEGQTVTVIGEKAYVNGKKVIAEDAIKKAGGLTYKVTTLTGNKTHTHFVTNAGEELYSVTISDPFSATGYMMNVGSKMKKQEVQGYCASTCSARPGGIVAQVSSDELLFCAEEVEQLKEVCGGDTVLTPHVGCDVGPGAEGICAATSIDYSVAEAACKEAAPCAPDDGIKDCIFDYCEMGGDSSAGPATAEAYPCPEEVDEEK